MPSKNLRIINLPKIEDSRGSISVIEGAQTIPFEIARIYYLYDISSGSERGSHAHKNLSQFFVAISGSFDVEIDNGFEKKRFHLNRPYYGLHVPPMSWRNLNNFSSGAVCLVLASSHYDENDYIRDYGEFKSSVSLIK